MEMQLRAKLHELETARTVERKARQWFRYYDGANITGTTDDGVPVLVDRNDLIVHDLDAVLAKVRSGSSCLRRAVEYARAASAVHDLADEYEGLCVEWQRQEIEKMAATNA